MKRLVHYGLLLGVLSLSLHGESRTWTDAKSGKTIEGEMKARSLGKDRIQLALSDKKLVWIELERLSDEDRKYAQLWVSPENHIATRVLKSGQGWKEVGIIAHGGTSGGTVVMFRKPDDPNPIRTRISPGKSRSLTFRGTGKWMVQFQIEKVVVDEEDGTHKTGERNRR